MNKKIAHIFKTCEEWAANSCLHLQSPQRWKSNHRLHTTPAQNGRGCNFPFAIFNIHKRDGERRAPPHPKYRWVGWGSSIRSTRAGIGGTRAGSSSILSESMWVGGRCATWREWYSSPFWDFFHPFKIGLMTPLPRDYLACRVFLGPLSIVVRGCQRSVLDRSPLQI